MTAALPSGRTPASTLSAGMPSCPATARAVRSLSPVSSTGRRPSLRSRAMAAGAPGRSWSATISAARACPSQPARTAVRPASPAAVTACRRAAGTSSGQLLEQREAADRDVRGRPRGPGRPHPGSAAKPVTGGRPPRRAAASLAIAWPMGCSEASSTAPASSSASFSPVARRGDHVGDAHGAVGQGAGLVQHHDPDPAGRLERPGALDQDAELGAAADRRHQRGGRGQAERARAGDYEHRDGGAPRGGAGQAGAQPEAERRGGDADHARHEDGGDPVRDPLRARLAGLRLDDQPGDLGQQRVRADPGGPHDQPAAHVHRGPRHRVAGPDLGGHRLAGDKRRVDRRGALGDDAVGGDLLPRADHEQLPGAPVQRRAPAVRHRRAAPRRSWRRGPPARSAPTWSGSWRGPRGTGRRARRWPPPRRRRSTGSCRWRR